MRARKREKHRNNRMKELVGLQQQVNSINRKSKKPLRWKRFLQMWIDKSIQINQFDQ